MTLLEAIQTGLPFKIPEMIDYLYVGRGISDPTDFLFWMEGDTKCGPFPVYSLFAQNWEILDVPNNVLTFHGKPIPPRAPDEAS